MTADAKEEEQIGLKGAYSLDGPEAVQGFYDKWAQGYEAEVAENGYVTPQRCADALAEHAADPTAPLVEFGCGTGLGGLALKARGFTTIDGFDFSEEMLAGAREKGIYRSVGFCDLSQPIEMEPESYANAAAIGVISPDYMPVSVIDEILKVIMPGGVFVFSVNDHSAADGSINARIMDLTDCCAADLMVSDYGEHLPGTGLMSTVYALRKR